MSSVTDFVFGNATPGLFYFESSPAVSTLERTWTPALPPCTIVISGIDFCAVGAPGDVITGFMGLDASPPVLIDSRVVAPNCLGLSIPWRGGFMLPRDHSLFLIMTASSTCTLALSVWGYTLPLGESVGELVLI
ncbi:MAG: hypothetical protein JO244_10775 [Solirubrobacterales bacterium]|nr:hypothetical protein [Solirubrobacterales bacterium]